MVNQLGTSQDTSELHDRLYVSALCPETPILFLSARHTLLTSQPDLLWTVVAAPEMLYLKTSVMRPLPQTETEVRFNM